MPVIEVEQGSADWLKMRVGMCTGSRIIDVVTKLKKGGYCAARQDYLMELVVERLTGLNADNYVSPAMQWGIDNEQFAVAAYEIERDVMLEPGGFAMHPEIKWFGASPDRRIGENGLLEVKCPTSRTHLRYLIENVVPIEYQPQMLAEMACSEREYVDFVSFDPRFPPGLQLFVKRFERNDELIAIMETEIRQFLTEVEAMEKQVREFERSNPWGIRQLA
jgi:putative phage-type endonuclease